MEDEKRKPGRPKGKRVVKFSTVIPPEERRYLEELAEAWNMPQNAALVRLIRFARLGEPLPGGRDDA